MKVIIISHNPVSSHNAMGKTICSLFEGIAKEKICQLYIYPTFPDVDICNSYYRVTDIDVLKTPIISKTIGRKIIFDKSKIDNDFNSAILNKNYRSSNPVKRLMRDIMWRTRAWYSKSLDEWIKQQEPNVIFIAPGDACFLYHIGLKISKKFRIPIVTYICDDYYFKEIFSCNIERFRYFCLRKCINKLLKKSTYLIGICEELTSAYCTKFKVQGSTVMTSRNSFVEFEENYQNKEIKEITYMGEIRYERYRSLYELGIAFDRINNNFGKNIRLIIYTDEKDDRYLADLKKAESIQLKGFVSGSEYNRVFNSAECFLHVEAFDKEIVDLIKYSISTKIPNIISSGKPFLVYGPKESGSVSYLLNNNCAYCILNNEELESKLMEFLTYDFSTMRNNARRVSNKNHSLEKNAAKVHSIIESAAK